MERLLYAEITCLTHKEGYCYATNKYFADLYEVNKDTVSGWVNSLVRLGYIRVEIIDKYRRKIYLRFESLGGTVESPRGVGEKTEGGRRKDRGGVGEKTDNNNISNNITNTRENNKSLAKKELSLSDYKEIGERLKVYWNKTFAGTDVPQVTIIGERRAKAIRARLNDKDTHYTEDDLYRAIDKGRNSNRCLNGGWFNFDWVFIKSANNLVKTLEGYYDKDFGSDHSKEDHSALGFASKVIDAAKEDPDTAWMFEDDLKPKHSNTTQSIGEIANQTMKQLEDRSNG